MPAIKINDYNWHQTHEDVIITTKLIGNPKKVDIFAIENYLKVSYSPFILELFLWGNIVEEQSQCILEDSSAILRLKKVEIGREWPCLIIEELSKDEKNDYRKIAIERAQLSAEKRTKEKSEKQQELQRQAVRDQINLDTIKLNNIEAIRDEHRKQAMLEFDDWRMNSELPIFKHETPVIQQNRKSYRTPVKWLPQADVSSSSESKEVAGEDEKRTGTSDLEPNVLISEVNDEDEVEEEDEEKKQAEDRRKNELIDKILNGKLKMAGKSRFHDADKSIPMPRQLATIDVTFSERGFPTPARESCQLEEQEWLEKQAEARRKCGFVTEDLRPEEQNPQLMKDKGDEFFKVGNYLGAISAYTHGIKLSSKMSCLYANRSAAQYAIANYQRCAEDCSTALELMVPKCEGNRLSRARCHARLGATLCQLGKPQHGVVELEEALKLCPDNETIKFDLQSAKQFVESQ